MPVKGQRSTHCKRGHPRTPENMFPSGSGKNGPKCKPCQILRRQERLIKGDIWWKTESGKRSIKFIGIKCRYNVTKEEYENQLAKQNECCAICGIKLDSSTKSLIPQVDHAHDETQRFRGLLCGRCNPAIGLFNEDVQILEKAIQYLKETQNGVGTPAHTDSEPNESSKT